jgi:hypothetical protein
VDVLLLSSGQQQLGKYDHGMDYLETQGGSPSTGYGGTLHLSVRAETVFRRGIDDESREISGALAWRCGAPGESGAGSEAAWCSASSRTRSTGGGALGFPAMKLLHKEKKEIGSAARIYIHTCTRGRDKSKRCTCTSWMKVAAVQGIVSVGLD